MLVVAAGMYRSYAFEPILQVVDVVVIPDSARSVKCTDEHAWYMEMPCDES